MAKIGLIQVDNKMVCDIEKRQNSLIELGTKCLEEGADLVFFPEAFQYVGNRQVVREPDRMKEIAEEWKERCAALARIYHAYVVPWDYYVGEDGRVRNSSYILDREGEFVGRYCKCNLTASELKRGLVQGTDYPVFDLDIGRVGIIICFDNYFPEAAAALGNRGAQLILYPLYGDTLKPQWEMKLRTRAIDHSLYMASCQLDPFWDIAYTGMVDPEGNVISKLESANSYRVVDIEMGREVRTNTSLTPSCSEDLREYLHKCRNYRSYTALATEGTTPKAWEEIFENYDRIGK